MSLAASDSLSIVPYMDLNYSSNIYWDSSAVSDATFSPGLELNFDSRRFNVFLNADGRIYQNNEQLNQSTISGGLSFYKVLSKRATLFLSPDFSLTQFKGDMSYLNNVIPSLAVGLKHIFSPRLYSRVGLSWRHSDYLEENSYDRSRLAAFWETSLFFRTQTTLRLTLGMNYLHFPHIITEIPATFATVAKSAAAITATAAAEPYNRRGNPGQPPPDPPAPPPPTPPQPPSPPAKPTPQPEPQEVSVSSTTTLSIPQPFAMFRIAQGLGYKTGLIAEVQFRKNQNQVQSLEAMIIDEWALQRMDEDFFWQGTRFSLALRTEAAFKTEIAVDFSYILKQYNGIGALDLEGDPIVPLAMRKDKLAQVSLKIARSFGKFGFTITGSFRRNVSNDLYFLYDFYTIAAGMDMVI